MKANLTRGNSITENHNPYDGAYIEEILMYGFAIVDMHVQQARELRKRYKSGAAPPIIKENGAEIILQKQYLKDGSTKR